MDAASQEDELRRVYAELGDAYATYAGADLVDPVATAEVEFVLGRVGPALDAMARARGTDGWARLHMEARRMIARAAKLLGVEIAELDGVVR